MKMIPHWIAGAPHAPAETTTSPVYNPATGQVCSEVLLGRAADVDKAVAAARAAFDSWRYTSLSRRTEVLFRFRELVAAHVDDIADVIVREHGKVRSDARGEVKRGLDVVDFATGIPQLLKGSFSENVATDLDTYSLRQP